MVSLKDRTRLTVYLAFLFTIEKIKLQCSHFDSCLSIVRSFFSSESCFERKKSLIRDNQKVQNNSKNQLKLDIDAQVENP